MRVSLDEAIGNLRDAEDPYRPFGEFIASPEITAVGDLAPWAPLVLLVRPAVYLAILALVWVLSR
jgi:hypothetical protein